MSYIPIPTRYDSVDPNSSADINQLQENISVHVFDASAHGATDANTASRIILRDASGNAKVSDPIAPTDIANRQWVDKHVGVELSGGAARTTAGNILFSTALYYNSSGYNATTGVWTCPESGTYLICAGVTKTTSVGTISIKTSKGIFSVSSAAGYGQTPNGIVTLSIGDTVYIDVDTNGVSAGSIMRIVRVCS